MKDLTSVGFGVMIGMLSGNEESVLALQDAIGKQIKSVELVEDKLRITLENDKVLVIADEGQSCCEHRYMVTDDDLTYFTDCELMKIEVKDAPNEKDEYGEHEVQFLEVTTDKGSFQMASHNEHSGYYGGFLIRASIEEAA